MNFSTYLLVVRCVLMTDKVVNNLFKSTYLFMVNLKLDRCFRTNIKLPELNFIRNHYYNLDKYDYRHIA